MKALRFNVNVPRWLALKALGTFKKEVYYRGRLATVSLDDIADPVLPGPDWVKIKTRLTGFCASDLNLIFLRDSPTASPFGSFPCVMGHEVCGDIEEAGPAVKKVNVGDRVTIAPHLNCRPRQIEPECRACRTGRVGSCENFAEGKLAPGMFSGICSEIGGGFAPYLVAHESQVFVLPEGVLTEEGAMIEPLSVALAAVLENRPGKEDQVLVIGGGVIGTLIVQVISALDCGCTVTVSEPSPFSAEMARSAGAHHLITDGDLFSGTVKITGARRYKPMMGQDILMGGFNRVFDCVGNSGTLNTAMRCMAVGGVLSIVGIGHDVKLDLTPLWLKLQTVKGVFAYGMTDTGGGKKHVFEMAIDMVANKKIKMEKMLTHKFAIDDYEALIETNLEKSRHRAIKTAVTFES